MTGTQLLLLGLVVVAAVVAGYFIGRWSTEREQGARAARPNPLPAPDEDAPEEPAQRPVTRQRGTPPPANAGGDWAQQEPTPRQRSGAPPPAASGEQADGPSTDAAPRRVRRGPPPPAAAGIIGTGDTTKRDR